MLRISLTFASEIQILYRNYMKELRIGSLELNPQKQELLLRAPDGTQDRRKLSFREASVLRPLIEAHGEIVENHILLMEFWGTDSVYSLNSLYVFMSRLKQLLALDSSLTIVNARGIGYRLIRSE